MTCAQCGGGERGQAPSLRLSLRPADYDLTSRCAAEPVPFLSERSVRSPEEGRFAQRERAAACRRGVVSAV